LQLVQQVNELLSDAERNNQQMLKVGEINNTDYLLIQQLNNSMRQKIQFYFSGTAKNEQELLYLSGLDAKVKDTVLTALPIQLNATLSNSLYSENELKIKQLEQQQKVIKSAFQPTFQVGYFNQSLDKVNNFQGIKGGLVVPLFFGGKRNELTINRLQQETITVQQNNLKKQLTNELKLLEQNILMMQKTFEGKQPNMNENIKGLEQLQQKLNLGEINTFDFIKLSSIVIDGSLSELDMLNNYNQNVIKYQFLTTNF
jgi:outer membrane protein TolC